MKPWLEYTLAIAAGIICIAVALFTAYAIYITAKGII